MQLKEYFASLEVSKHRKTSSPSINHHWICFQEFCFLCKS